MLVRESARSTVEPRTTTSLLASVEVWAPCQARGIGTGKGGGGRSGSPHEAGTGEGRLRWLRRGRLGRVHMGGQRPHESPTVPRFPPLGGSCRRLKGGSPRRSRERSVNRAPHPPCEHALTDGYSTTSCWVTLRLRPGGRSGVMAASACQPARAWSRRAATS